MKRKRWHFWVGFWIGAALCVVLWYYQKSTSSEDAALNLLDDLAERSRQLRPDIDAAEARSTSIPDVAPQMRQAAVVSSPDAKPMPADDLTAIRGIGPVYAARLQEAGITTFAALAAQDPARVAEIVGRKRWQAASPADWISQARELGQDSG